MDTCVYTVRGIYLDLYLYIYTFLVVFLIFTFYITHLATDIRCASWHTSTVPYTQSTLYTISNDHSTHTHHHPSVHPSFLYQMSGFAHN